MQKSQELSIIGKRYQPYIETKLAKIGVWMTRKMPCNRPRSFPNTNGLVAQGLERWSYIPLVLGSNPSKSNYGRSSHLQPVDAVTISTKARETHAVQSIQSMLLLIRQATWWEEARVNEISISPSSFTTL